MYLALPPVGWATTVADSLVNFRMSGPKPTVPGLPNNPNYSWQPTIVGTGNGWKWAPTPAASSQPLFVFKPVQVTSTPTTPPKTGFAAITSNPAAMIAIAALAFVILKGK
jgi:hypothetical protein